VILLAYGPAEDAEPIVLVGLNEDGSITIELEREDATETLHISAPGVSERLRALVSEEAAA
jgi:hypothetical protein